MFFSIFLSLTAICITALNNRRHAELAKICREVEGRWQQRSQ